MLHHPTIQYTALTNSTHSNPGPVIHTPGCGDHTHSNPGQLTHMIQGDIEMGVGGGGRFLFFPGIQLSIVLTKGDIKY